MLVCNKATLILEGFKKLCILYWSQVPIWDDFWSRQGHQYICRIVIPLYLLRTSALGFTEQSSTFFYPSCSLNTYSQHWWSAALEKPWFSTNSIFPGSEIWSHLSLPSEDFLDPQGLWYGSEHQCSQLLKVKVNLQRRSLGKHKVMSESSLKCWKFF